MISKKGCVAFLLLFVLLLSPSHSPAGVVRCTELETIHELSSADVIYQKFNSQKITSQRFNILIGDLLYEAKKIGDNRIYAEYLGILANNKLNYNKISEAALINQKAENMLNFLRDFEGAGVVLINKIRLYRKQGKYSEFQLFINDLKGNYPPFKEIYEPILYRELAYLENFKKNKALCNTYLDKSYHLICKLHNGLYRGNLLSSLAISARDLGYVALAANCFEMALTEYDSSHDSSRVIMTYVNLSGLLSQQYHLERAKSYCIKGLNIAKAYSDQNEIRPLYSYCLNALGDLFLKERAFSTADSLFKIAIQEWMYVGDSSLLIFPLCNRAIANLKIGNVRCAHDFVNRASQIGEKSNDLLKQVVIRGAKGLVASAVGQNSQAEMDLIFAVKGSEELGIKDLCLDFYKGLAEVESRLGNYDKAYTASENYQSLNDSLKKVEAAFIAASVSEKVNNSELENKLNQLIERLKSRELLISFLFSPYFILLITLLVLIYLFKEIYLRGQYKGRILMDNTFGQIPMVVTHRSKEAVKGFDNSDAKEKGYVLKDVDLVLKDKLEKTLIASNLWCNSELNMIELADIMQTNTTYLSRLINRAYGVNFSTFINRYRVHEVCRLLKQGEANHQTIEALALRSGFKSRSSFHSAFKKEIGVTPTQFLERLEMSISK